MNEELLELLRTEYQYGIEAQTADDAESDAAHRSGDMAGYFDRALHWQLPDICWALAKWDEAQYWYRHNALMVTKSRAWHSEHSGPDYPINLLSDREASTLIKAGDIEAGRESLKRAITYWRDQSGSELVLTVLGLHAAQAGLPELATYASSIIDARQELPGGRGEAVRQSRELLHYEPAQISLLLGQWDQFANELEKLARAERLLKGNSNLAFPAPLQEALLAASQGLRTLASLYTGKVAPERGKEMARLAFEEAMLNFYRFSGQIDWDLYFMRLNTRFADELAAGRPIDPNPFSK